MDSAGKPYILQAYHSEVGCPRERMQAFLKNSSVQCAGKNEPDGHQKDHRHDLEHSQLQ
jgi:hypothetical protein